MTDNLTLFLCGKCRNEGFGLLSARTAKGYSEKREHHINDLIFERLSGKMLLPYISEKQAECNALKAQALATYNQNKAHPAVEVGFIDHPDYMVVSQPDGLVGDDGGVIIRTHLIPRHHISFLKNPVVPDDTLKIIWGFFWVTGREWCDYVSYCPDLPDELQISTVRVYVDRAAVGEWAKDIELAMRDVEKGAESLSLTLEQTA